MYDATNALAVPRNGDLYAGYLDGYWRSYTVLVRRFGKDRVVPVTVYPHSTHGLVGDGPPDNGTWGEWVSWVKRRRSAGIDPTMYTNLSSWPEGRKAFSLIGVPDPHWWIADWDGRGTAVPARAVAKQWQSYKGYDVSAVLDHWPGVDAWLAAQRHPQTTTTTTQGADMQTHQETVQVHVATGHGWAALPVKVSQLVGAPFVQDANPKVVGHYVDIPTGVAIATQPAPTAPNGVVVVSGGADGTYGVTLTVLT